jgi:hypothetical protein
MKRIVHIIGRTGYTTLCGRSSDRTRWVREDRAEEVNCGDCRNFMEGAKMRAAREAK